MILTAHLLYPSAVLAALFSGSDPCTSGGQISHFSAAFLFALFSSIVFGICFRNAPRDMVRYGAYCFAVFMVGMWLAGWVMWLIHH